MTPNQIEPSLQANTFIPKQPVNSSLTSFVKPKPKSSFLLYVGMVILVISLLFSGISYFLQARLSSSIAGLQQQLGQISTNIDESQIDEIAQVDKKLDLAKEVFSGHKVASPLFVFLQEKTLPEVAYKSFSYDGSRVTLSGESLGYEVIAQQSDVFSSSDELAEHVFSGFRLDDFGKVLFELTITPKDTLTLFYLE